MITSKPLLNRLPAQSTTPSYTAPAGVMQQNRLPITKFGATETHMKTEMPKMESDPDAVEQNAIIQNALNNGAIRYIHGCESRIEDFVSKYYSFRGAIRLHSYAIGLDIVRAPFNIIWSVVNILLALAGFIAGLVRLRRIQNWIKKIPPGLETDMDRQISWLVVTELLQLPHEQGNKRHIADALMEEIMKDPPLQRLVNEKLETFDRASSNPDFRGRLDEKLREYGATRTGSSDLSSNAVLLITSKIAIGEAAFGTLSAGTSVSAIVAHSIAVSNFWLGSTVGSYYYAVAPVAVTMRLLMAMTAIVAVVLAIVSTFIGIVTDPIQARLGLHQKRLRKLVHAIRDDLQGSKGANFALREKYIGRIFDVIDILSTVGRSL